MRVSDLILEVRDRNLKRVGQITGPFLNMKARLPWCGVGEWELELPAEHPMAPHLSAPGSGVILSGPVSKTFTPRQFSAWVQTRRNLFTNPAVIAQAGFNTGDATTQGAVSYGGGAVRYTLAGTAAAAFGFSGVAQPVAGQEYRVLIRARANRPLDARLRVRNGTYGPLVTIGTAWEWFEAIVPAGTSTNTSQTGLLFAGNAGHEAGDWVEVNRVLIADGSDTGEWFGGSSVDGVLARSSFVGTVDGSETIYEARTVTAEPRSEIVTGVLFSGPTLAPNRKRSPKTPRGTLKFKGATDMVLLADATAYPSPAVADPAAQTAANDVRTGTTEDLLRQYVAYNIASTHAPAARRSVGFRSKLTIDGTSQARGLTQTKSPRFQNLLELCREIVTYDPSLGFDVVQSGQGLVFRVRPTRDLRKTIRFDIANGTLTSEESQTQGASLTRAIVAGQGEGTERTIVTRTTPQAAQDEALWGRIIDGFIDKRDSDDIVELTQAGDEALLEAAGGASIKIIPADEFTMEYGLDWREGDRVTAVVDGGEAESIASEAVLLIGPDGVRVGAAVGKVTEFDARDALTVKVSALDSRVSNLERASQIITPDMLPMIPDAALPSRLIGQNVADWNVLMEPGFVYGGASSLNSPGEGGTWVGTALWNGNRFVVEVSNATVTLGAMKKTYRRVWTGGSWTGWYETSRHDAPVASPTPVAPFALYGAHSGGTPSAAPFVRISGGFCSIKVVVVNEGTSAVSISGGGIVGENFPVPLTNWTITAVTMLTSSLGQPRTEFGAQIDSGGKLGIRGASYAVPAGDKFVLMGVYPVDSTAM